MHSVSAGSGDFFFLNLLFFFIIQVSELPSLCHDDFASC